MLHHWLDEYNCYQYKCMNMRSQSASLPYIKNCLYVGFLQKKNISNTNLYFTVKSISVISKLMMNSDLLMFMLYTQCYFG